MAPQIRRIISGGQTGADRAALDAALDLGVECGGFCPRGRRAEDGPIPARYPLREMTTASYAARTEKNVLSADATLLVTRGAPTGGSALTVRLARQHHRPILCLDLATSTDPVAEIKTFLAHTGAHVVNVAGPRESTSPGIGTDVYRLLRSILAGP